MNNPFKKFFGPSTLVAAAFIGPGTVTVCTLAGVRSGYMLIWALVFSVAATVILQEMTGRLGIVSRKGFGEAIRDELANPFIKIIGVLLILGAIVVGNAAYEGGNISGAVLGIESVAPALNVETGSVVIRGWPVIIGAVAFMLLFTGSFKIISGFLIGLVSLMSLVFLTTAIIIQPDLTEILKGMFLPRYTDENLLTVVALVGTTVVPYNLFLHASVVQERYRYVSQLSEFRMENAAGIILGGLISVCIIITSAAAFEGEGATVNSAADMARQLEPLLGSWATAFMGGGLFAAGISSAITAPLAAAYAARGIFGWRNDLKDNKFRFVWMLILITGVIFSSLSINPVQLIEFAQLANGILLPFVAVFLLYIVNRVMILGANRNTTTQNVLGIIVVMVTILLGIRSINSVLNFL